MGDDAQPVDSNQQQAGSLGRPLRRGAEVAGPPVSDFVVLCLGDAALVHGMDCDVHWEHKPRPRIQTTSCWELLNSDYRVFADWT